MTNFHVTRVLMLLMAVAILSAGCMGQDGLRKNVGNVPSTVFITPSTPMPLQNPQNGYWINTDPISDKWVADILSDKTNRRYSAVNQSLPVLYTEPIGGYEVTEETLEPNTTFETNYIFYSRNWGRGK